MAEALVSIRSLSFRWNGHEAPCLKIAAFDLAAGERVMLCGPSGSGKSTLLGLLGGVLTPQSGSIRILGQELSSMTARARDRFRVDHIGFIFQQFNLVSYLSAQENVLLPCRFSQRRAERAGASSNRASAMSPVLTVGSVGSRSNDPGEDARTLLESIGVGPQLWRRPVADLSVGEQQRVAAARALIGRPELIIADEPTSALDADTQQVFLDLLMRQCEQSDAALLFVSHDSRLSVRFQRVVALGAINQANQAAAT